MSPSLLPGTSAPLLNNPARACAQCTRSPSFNFNLSWQRRVSREPRLAKSSKAAAILERTRQVGSSKPSSMCLTIHLAQTQITCRTGCGTHLGPRCHPAPSPPSRPRSPSLIGDGASKIVPDELVYRALARCRSVHGRGLLGPPTSLKYREIPLGSPP